MALDTGIGRAREGEIVGRQPAPVARIHAPDRANVASAIPSMCRTSASAGGWWLGSSRILRPALPTRRSLSRGHTSTEAAGLLNFCSSRCGAGLRWPTRGSREKVLRTLPRSAPVRCRACPHGLVSDPSMRTESHTLLPECRCRRNRRTGSSACHRCAAIIADSPCGIPLLAHGWRAATETRVGANVSQSRHMRTRPARCSLGAAVRHANRHCASR